MNIEECKQLTQEEYHSDPRGESDGYMTNKFNKERANKLFEELKQYFSEL